MLRFTFLIIAASAAFRIPAPPLPKAPPLTWCQAPDRTWQFNGHNVNYIAAGPETGLPFLLIHGFGASGFHWRRNVNVLAAAGYRVYAIDLLGFGFSAKPVMDYDGHLWRDQCAAFLREIADCGRQDKRAVVAGNSIGGCTGTAHAPPQNHPS